ncbi:MAG TPA: fatty acid CoA ligase family protein [Planctomycetaceae bacterium]|nr:fatty acid CoA ligase family protein [Planctomycetaceae bacterium]
MERLLADGVELRPTAMNIAERLRATARERPFQRAVVCPAGRDRAGRVAYTQLTFRQLDQESDRLARGLAAMGVRPGTRLVLMVRPGLEFIALTFGLFKAGAVVVLIDPGMGRSNIFRCLEHVEPEGFVAIPLVQAIRALNRRRFRRCRFNVTVGRRWFWGGPTYGELLGGEWTPFEMAATRAGDPAAIIFTSGSTGPPKGVVYEHGMFDAQVDMLREFYGVRPGEVDLSGFPLFALFNAAMGVTTVIPDMDPTRPAAVDPRRILEAVRDQGVTQAFGSPAIWNRVGRHAERHGTRFDSLKRVLSAGAPVPLHVLERMTRALPDDGDIHTPYGATESLPIASIGGREILSTTAARSRAGGGTCVGRLFPGVRVKIIDITGGPIASLADVRELAAGEIGEIIVSSPSTTRDYFREPAATRAAKSPTAKGSGTAWATWALSMLTECSGSAAARRTSWERLTARCSQFRARRSSTSTPACSAARWSASARSPASSPCSWSSLSRAVSRRRPPTASSSRVSCASGRPRAR